MTAKHQVDTGLVVQVQSIAEGEMQGLARMAARRKRSFASSADALSRLGHRPGFSDLTAASLAAYVMHCFVTDAGVLASWHSIARHQAADDGITAFPHAWC